MRKLFPGYYTPTEMEFNDLWNNCLFIFDANVLLNLYRYSEKTCNELIEIMKKVSDRVWIPHQVALDYHKNRLNVIGKQKKAYSEIKNILDDSFNKLNNELNNYLKHPLIDVTPVLNEISELFDKIIINLKKQESDHPDLFQNDNIRDEITVLFEDKVGPEYSEEDLKKIYDQGEKRYEKGIPPGYSDSKKAGKEKYGDLVLWFQILDKAKQCQSAIILVTDDTKEDWWWKYGDNITIGPRPELAKEMISNANVMYYMYRSEKFMEYANNFLGRTVDEEAIAEVREIRKRDDSMIKLMKTMNELDIKELKILSSYKERIIEEKRNEIDILICGATIAIANLKNELVRLKQSKNFNDEDVIAMMNRIYSLEKYLKEKEKEKRLIEKNIFLDDEYVSSIVIDDFINLVNDISEDRGN